MVPASAVRCKWASLFDAESLLICTYLFRPFLLNLRHCRISLPPHRTNQQLEAVSIFHHDFTGARPFPWKRFPLRGPRQSSTSGRRVKLPGWGQGLGCFRRHKTGASRSGNDRLISPFCPQFQRKTLPFTFLLMMKCWSECKETHNHCCIAKILEIKSICSNHAAFLLLPFLVLPFFFTFLDFFFFFPPKRFHKRFLIRKTKSFRICMTGKKIWGVTPGLLLQQCSSNYTSAICPSSCLCTCLVTWSSWFMRTKSCEKRHQRRQGPNMEKWLAINIAYHAKSGSLFCIDPRNRLATLIKLPKDLHKDLQINPLSICAETSLNLMDIYHLMPAFSWCLPYNSCNKRKSTFSIQHAFVQNKVEGVLCWIQQNMSWNKHQSNPRGTTIQYIQSPRAWGTWIARLWRIRTWKQSWKGNCHGTIGLILLTSHWNCFSWLFSASSPSSPIFWRPISIIVPLFFLGNLKVQISTPICGKWSNVHTILVSCILGLVSKYVCISGIFINAVILQSSCGFPLITKHPYASLVHCPNNTSYIILPSSMPSSAAPWRVSAAWIPNESPRWCSPLTIHLEGRYLRPRSFGWILAFPKFWTTTCWESFLETQKSARLTMDIRIFDHFLYPELNRNKLVTTMDCSHFTMGEITPGTRQNDPLLFGQKIPDTVETRATTIGGNITKNRSFFRTFMKLMLGLKATSNTLGNPGCSKSPVFFGKNSIFMTFWVGRDTGTLDIWRNLGKKMWGRVYWWTYCWFKKKPFKHQEKERSASKSFYSNSDQSVWGVQKFTISLMNKKQKMEYLNTTKKYTSDTLNPSLVLSTCTSTCWLSHVQCYQVTSLICVRTASKSLEIARFSTTSRSLRVAT